MADNIKMADNIIRSGLNLMNTAFNGSGGTVISGEAVKGGYFVTPSIEITSTGEEGKIPDYACVTGTLCYCTGDSKFYQYNGTAWVVANLGGGSGAVDLTEAWTFTLEDGTVITKNVVTVLGAGTATEDWTFTHEDGSTVTKKVVIE